MASRARNVRNRLLALVAFIVATPALAQEPSQAQRDAVKANCRSDYMANCSRVPPGGKESLMCLQQNLSKLSGGCKQAVTAIIVASEPKPAASSNPPPAPPAPAAAAPAAPPPAASAPAATAAAPTAAPAPAASPAPKPAAKPAAKPVAAPAAAAAPPPPPPPPTVAAAPVAPPPPIPLREEIFIVRNACAAESRDLCSGIPPGGGRIIACLRANAAALSPRCQGALMVGR